ncbi:chemotaxis protein CheW [Synechocystis sp. PCC 7509]|uniref:chemotaxis protein CheW n=1 Tax=Synechocystis sp. PCC 7509 TaxID=927677 RepID=UPI0002ABAA2B|nr:chemotaxis protein CheW [Synechocystis sp. PCC 7509]
MINDYFCGQLRQSINVLFPLESTEEVIALTYGEICPVPGVSSALIGVVNQRGKLLWVLDLSDLLQIAPDKETRRSPDNLTLLVLNDNKNNGQQIGCVVSTLKGIIPLDLAEKSLNLTSFLEGEFIKTSIMFDNEKYAVIDVQAVLNNIFDSHYFNNLAAKL